MKQSQFTQVVNDVQIISAAEQSAKAAAVNDILAMPDILRTGVASRAELVAQDQTVTRVGASTIFSFDPTSRTIDLKQGSLLFHAPHGKGGGSIHTGAATASVLGTTVIVATTTNGGFKVLALEGQVQVKLPNGLKQKLSPGQMTFILPGASQLAPVIIFRLEELVGSSLLVGGFTDTLDSWPLIEAEVARQEKLIHSGRLSDTPYYVGDDATPSQVQVLDINTIVQQVTPASTAPGISQAENGNATINQPSLIDASVPTPPNHIFNSLSAPDGSSGSGYQGFLAGNITFDAPANSDSGGLSVDLSPYSDSGPFAFIARKDINFNCSVDFSGLLPSDDLYLYAIGNMNFAENITLSAYVNDFLLWSGGDMNLAYVNVQNTKNNLILISGGSITANQSHFSAGGDLSLVAGSNLGITSSSLSGNTVSLMSTAGSVTVQNTSVSCQNFYVSAKNDINYTGQYSTAPKYLKANSGILLSPTGKYISQDTTLGTAIFTAGNQANVNNVDFTQFGSVIITAKTIVLTSDAFPSGGIYNFGSQNGSVTVNAANSGGLSLWNCTYNNAPINTTDNNYIRTASGPGTTPGIITSYASK